jgi:hypothetical protein
MVLIWLGALLLVSGIVFMVARPLQGRLSGSRLRSEGAANTLEPRRPARGFGLASNWPGLALVALGAVLLLGWAVFRP